MSDFKFDIGANIDGVTKAFDKVKKEVSGLETVLKSFADTVIFDKLDKETDGFASKIFNLGKAIKDSLGEIKKSDGSGLFKAIQGGIFKATKGTLGLQKAWKVAKAAVSAFRTALIATGIGALVVAVGLLVAYWDDIVALVSGVSKETAKLTKELAKQEETQQRALTLLNSSTNTLKLQGKSQLEINKLKQKELNSLLLIKKAQISNFKDALNQLQARQDAIKKVIQSITGFLKRIIGGIQTLYTTALAGILTLVDQLPFIDIDVSKAIGGLNTLFNTAKVGIDKLGDAVLPDLGIKELKKDLADAELEAVKLQNSIDGLELQNIDIVKKANEKNKDKLTADDIIDIEGIEQDTADLQEFLNNLKFEPGLQRDKAIESAQIETFTQGLKDNLNNAVLAVDEGYTKIIDTAKANDELLKEQIENSGLVQIADGLGEVFGQLGSKIAGALGESAGIFGTFVGTIVQESLKLVASLIQASARSAIAAKKTVAPVVASELAKSKAGAISAASQTAGASGPAGAFLLPILIAGALAVISSAFSGLGGGGSKGGGGGASSSSGGGVSNNTSRSTTFQGNGGGRVVFEIAGDKLIGVINNSLSANDRIGAGQNID